VANKFWQVLFSAPELFDAINTVIAEQCHVHAGGRSLSYSSQYFMWKMNRQLHNLPRSFSAAFVQHSHVDQVGFLGH
jgi:hypothetical protein